MNIISATICSEEKPLTCLKTDLAGGGKMQCFVVFANSSCCLTLVGKFIAKSPYKASDPGISHYDIISHHMHIHVYIYIYIYI